MKWIPIKTRPMDEEERKELSEKIDYEVTDDEAIIITSPLPDDDDEVLVCTRDGQVYIDAFCKDDEGCYFEENGEIDGIVAWMPLPEPYMEE